MSDVKLISPRRYPNAHDASMRLSGTLIFYKGLPVYVVDVRGTKARIADAFNLEKPYVEVHTSDPRLCIESPQLGWTVGPRAFYVMRVPRRSQKQGLSLGNLLRYDPRRHDVQRGMSLEDLPRVANIAMNIYPDIADWPEGGFDRDWAVVRAGHGKCEGIFNKFLCVGIFDRKGNDFLFSPGLLTKNRKESLEKVLGKQKGEYNVNELGRTRLPTGKGYLRD